MVVQCVATYNSWQRSSQKRKCHVQMPHDVLFPFSLSAVRCRSILCVAMFACMPARPPACAIGAIAHVVANENI